MKTKTRTKVTNRLTQAVLRADETYRSPMASEPQQTPEISFVIPAMNEEDSLQELTSKIAEHVGTDNYEIMPSLVGSEMCIRDRLRDGSI